MMTKSEIKAWLKVESCRLEDIADPTERLVVSTVVSTLKGVLGE